MNDKITSKYEKCYRSKFFSVERVLTSPSWGELVNTDISNCRHPPVGRKVRRYMCPLTTTDKKEVESFKYSHLFASTYVETWTIINNLP